ncbi:hypothetical protein PIB30_071557 [Stylosanthes scabra]|uniref:Uncharacterized protein n=1 Tax=Stylosanthes scabra TaxID=79078 RepID=A0ABU6QNE4_9FABA|nr:hypothetical protein [Stylosanthes scabra]
MRQTQLGAKITMGERPEFNARNSEPVTGAAAGHPSNDAVARELKTCAPAYGCLVAILFVVSSVAGHFLSETGNVTFKDIHQGLSKQMMEGTYSYDQGYTPWNPPPYQHHAPQYNVYQSNGLGNAYYGYKDPPPLYLPSQGNFEDIFQVLQQGRKAFWETQKRLEAQLATVTELVTRLVTPSVASTSITSQPLNSGDLPSQALSIPRRSIPTLFLCANQEGREEAPPNEEDVENLNHEEVEKNEDQEAEDVDHEVENKDKEQKGMEIVHSASSKATPSKLPSELQFEWINFSNLNFIGPQHYGLLETNGQLKALCGVFDKKKENSAELRSEFKAYSGYLHKLHNNRTKVGALSSRKHLGPCQFQEKLVDPQNNGWTNQVWDPGKSYKS